MYSGFTDLYRHFRFHGGAFHSGFFAPYYTFVGSTQHISVLPRLRQLLDYILGHGWIQRRITTYFFKNEEKMPKQKNMHPEESWMRDFAGLAFDHPYDDAYYREKSAWPVLDRIQTRLIPISTLASAMCHPRGKFAFFPYDAPPYPARNTINHGGKQPSYLEVSLAE